MGILNIVPRILDALNDGSVIKRAVAYAMRFGAVLAGIVALLLAATVAKVAFGTGTTPEVTIALTLFLLIYLLSTACQIQILFYRARSVMNLESSQYAVVPVVSLLFRTFGESGATNFCFLGFGATLAIWVSKQNPLGMVGMNMMMPAFNPSDSYVAGAILLVWSFVLAFLVLLIFYFLAEVSLVGVDIAQGVRHLNRGAVAPAPYIPPPPVFVPPAFVPAPPPPPVPAAVIPPAAISCPGCRFEVKRGDLFCPICGTGILQ